MFNTNIWSEILFYVTPDDIDNIALLNKAYHELIYKSPDLWQFLIRKSYPRYIASKSYLEAKILRYHYRILNDIDNFYLMNKNVFDGYKKYTEKEILIRKYKIIAQPLDQNHGVKKYILLKDHTEVKIKIAKSYIITHIYNFTGYNNKLINNKLLLFKFIIHKCALEPQNYPSTLLAYYIDGLPVDIFDIHSTWNDYLKWNNDAYSVWNDITIICINYNFIPGLYRCQNYIQYLIDDSSKNAKTLLEYMLEVYSSVSIYFPEQMQFFAFFHENKVFTLNDERRIKSSITYRINLNQIDIVIILIKNLSEPSAAEAGEPSVSTDGPPIKWSRYPKFIINSLFSAENESSYIAIQKIAKKYKNLLPDDDVVFEHTPLMSISKVTSQKLKLVHHKNGHVLGYRK